MLDIKIPYSAFHNLFFSFGPEPLEINYCASKKKLGLGFSLFPEPAEINYWEMKKKLFPEKDFHFPGADGN